MCRDGPSAQRLGRGLRSPGPFCKPASHLTSPTIGADEVTLYKIQGGMMISLILWSFTEAERALLKAAQAE